MASGSLVVEPIQLRGLASAIAERAGNLSTNLKLVTAANENIAGSWIGADATAYTNKITEQQAAIQAMIDTLNSLSETMTGIANNYEQAQNDIAAAAGGR